MIFFQRKSALKRVAIFWIREPRFGFTHVVLAKSLHTFARHALVKIRVCKSIAMLSPLLL
jgi:hypothetical protein